MSRLRAVPADFDGGPVTDKVLRNKSVPLDDEARDQLRDDESHLPFAEADVRLDDDLMWERLEAAGIAASDRRLLELLLSLPSRSAAATELGLSRQALDRRIERIVPMLAQLLGW